MNFLESRRLLISTLSPVHVGCGEDYDPTHYVIEDDTLYEFEPGAAQKVLTDQDRRELLRIVGNPNNKRMLQEVQAFFYQRRQALMMVAKRRITATLAIFEPRRRLILLHQYFHSMSRLRIGPEMLKTWLPFRDGN